MLQWKVFAAADIQVGDPLAIKIGGLYLIHDKQACIGHIVYVQEFPERFSGAPYADCGLLRICFRRRFPLTFSLMKFSNQGR